MSSSGASSMPLAERQSTWSREETWKRWPVRWADQPSRSLLLFALGIAGLLVDYGLGLFLARPPALESSLVMRAIAVLLLVLATVVAPAAGAYRIAALFCIVLHAFGMVAIVLLQSTDAFGATTYGAFDAIELMTFGMLLAAWFLVRMRHPLTILIAMTSYAIASSAFFARVMPEVRQRLASNPYEERMDVGDEIVARAVLLLLMLGLVLFAWWLDGWMRALLPVANVAEPEGSPIPPRAGEAPRVRAAVLTMLVGLDPIAIAVALSAKRPTRHGRISAKDDWWVSIALGLATGKLSFFIVAVGAAIVWVLGTDYRAL